MEEPPAEGPPPEATVEEPPAKGPPPEAPVEEPPVGRPPAEAPTLEVPAVEEPPTEPPQPASPAAASPAAAHARADAPVTVTDIVDDLLSPGVRRGERIEEASVVEGSADELPAASDDAALAERVRAALAEQPGLLSGGVDVEATSGTVYLRGQVSGVETIDELERRTRAVPGVDAVRSRLSLTGTPPGSTGRGR